MKNLIKLCRPHQYIKNLFVFVGILFSGPEFLSFPILWKSILAFIAFCLAASSVYIFNDIMDVEADRAHPTKRNRPLASGTVSVRNASVVAGGLCLSAFLLSGMAGWLILACVGLYVLINIGYCLHWKHVPIIDVFLISSGFMLRVLAGTVGLGIPPSSWLLLCSFILTLFLGFSKRRAELLALERTNHNNKADVRRVLDQYSPIMIEQFTAITAACVIISYSLYTVSEETVARHHTNALIYTVPCVVYGIFRYLFLLFGGEGGNDTARDMARDKHLLLTGVAWLGLITGILLWPK